MAIHVRFFAYQGSDRHNFHYLHADREVASLDEFQYGQPLLVIESGTESRATAYIVADLPINRLMARDLAEAGPGVDIYLANEAYWRDFTSNSSTVNDAPYGTGL